jgi:hypothetical protein
MLPRHGGGLNELPHEACDLHGNCVVCLPAFAGRSWIAPLPCGPSGRYMNDLGRQVKLGRFCKPPCCLCLAPHRAQTTSHFCEPHAHGTRPPLPLIPTISTPRPTPPLSRLSPLPLSPPPPSLFFLLIASHNLRLAVEAGHCIAIGRPNPVPPASAHRERSAAA